MAQSAPDLCNPVFLRACNLMRHYPVGTKVTPRSLGVLRIWLAPACYVQPVLVIGACPNAIPPFGLKGNRAFRGCRGAWACRSAFYQRIRVAATARRRTAL